MDWQFLLSYSYSIACPGLKLKKLKFSFTSFVLISRLLDLQLLVVFVPLQPERECYEVVLENGKFVYKQSGKLLDTTGGPKDAKWIFVLSTSKTLYVGLKKKGTFQHSSFLAGGATLSAGRLIVENGVLKVEQKPYLVL